MLDCAWHVPPKPCSFLFCGAGGVSKPCRKARSAEQAQCRAGVRRTDVFFARPVHRDFRLPPTKLLARELAPDTVVAARPTGGHFGSQIRESAQERQHVLLRHGEKVGVLAFCHGLLKRVGESDGGSLVRKAALQRSVLCQEGNGGESASGGAKGDGGESALELGVVGDGGASQLLPFGLPNV